MDLEARGTDQCYPHSRLHESARAEESGSLFTPILFRRPSHTQSSFGLRHASGWYKIGNAEGAPPARDEIIKGLPDVGIT